jgi:Carboxypeptidase regulatory-like domain
MKLSKLLAIISFLFISSTVFAQTNGTFSGKVVDELGAIVKGVTITIISADGKEKNAVSNGQGEFQINGLAPGKYSVVASAAKFAPYENPEVEIGSGEKKEFVISMTVSGVKEDVTIDNANQVNTDADANAGATVLKEKDLESLPDDPDELEAALRALAGPSSGPNGGQFYIDGFTGGRIPPKESIREIRINQNPFSAEFERLGFGRVEILTKPGSDKLRGQANMNFNDESLNSRNPFAQNRASSQTRVFGGSLSGPIKKGKSSFFVDVNNRQLDNTAIINATVLNSANAITPFRQELTIPTRRLSISPRFDYQINEANTLVARYSFQNSKLQNQGVGGFSLPSRASKSSSFEHNVQLTETMIVNAKTVNESRFQYEYNRREQIGDNSIPTINVSGSFSGGGATVGTNYTNNKRWEFSNFTTTSFGKKTVHSIKFGGRIRGVNVADRSEQGFGGSYTFVGYLDPTCTITPTNTCRISPIEQYRRKVSGSINPLDNPNQFSITAGNPIANVSQYDAGIFITDDWKVRKDLNLSFGLRYENQTNIGSKFNFAPRFGYAWSPGAGGAKSPKTVFRGGAGIFYDRLGENYTLQANRFDGVQQKQYIVDKGSLLLGQPIFSSTGVTNGLTAAQLATIAPRTNTIRQVSKDYQAPYTIQGAFGVERQLPFKTTLSTFFIISRNVHVLRQRNINAPVCPPNALCPDTVQLPNPTKGPIYQFESTGFLNQRQLIMNFNTNVSNKISIFGNYRLSWAKGDAEGGGFFGGGNAAFPAYSYDLSGEYGTSQIGVKQGSFIGGSFTLPWKFRLSPTIIASSGVPYNITLGEDTNRDSLFTERPTYRKLANECQTRRLTLKVCDVSGVSNLDAIIPRNYGRGPATFNVNMNLSRTFGFGGKPAPKTTDTQQGGNRPSGGASGGGMPGMIGGGGGRGGEGGGGPRMMGGGFGGGNENKPYNLTFGMSVNNIFNRNNKGVPVGSLNSPQFGQSVGTGGSFGFFGGGGSNSGNRRVDLSLRFSF